MNNFQIDSDWLIRRSLKMAAKFTDKFIENKMVSPETVDKFFFDIWGNLYSGLQLKILPQPAVSIIDSVNDDYIICLEDGKKVKSLKNYILKNFNMTPDQYKKKWRLQKDYPMVSKNFSKKRSVIAKKTKKKNINNNNIFNI